MTHEAEDLSQLEARTRTLLDSDALTAPTRTALKARLEQQFETAALLSPNQRATLNAACLRLIPEPELVRRTALGAAFEAKLAQGFERGWRYADAPADIALHRAGLDVLDAAAQAKAAKPFAELEPPSQDTLLKAAAAGEPVGGQAFPEHWFEELLTALTELYYAHPLVQVSIGYDGMADAHGVDAVGLQAVAAEAQHLGD